MNKDDTNTNLPHRTKQKNSSNASSLRVSYHTNMINITVIIFILLRILSFIVINIYDSRNLLVDQVRAKPWQPFETYLIFFLLLSCWCDKKHYNKEQLGWGRVYLGSWFQKDESLLLWGARQQGAGILARASSWEIAFSTINVKQKVSGSVEGHWNLKQARSGMFPLSRLHQILKQHRQLGTKC